MASHLSEKCHWEDKKMKEKEWKKRHVAFGVDCDLKDKLEQQA